jgi:PAS domain S-box-containing protein
MTDQNFDALVLIALLDAIPDAVLMSDAAGVITRANPAAGTLFGYDPATLIGQSVNMLMPQALSDRHDGFMQGYLDTGTARIIGRGRAVEGQRRDGQVFPLHLSIGRADHGGATHFVAILHDLSARAAAEDALARSARLDAIGQMTGGISHDFSNILTVVIGNIELLAARVTGAENQAMLADALEAAELGAQLTAGLTTFARKATTQTAAINVNASCKAAIGMIERTFDPHYAISAQLGEDLPDVMADATQLQSALINIALNGRDAMPKGGQLIIRSEAISIDDTYIAQELDVAQGAYVRISVTDNGRGMGPDTQQRVFEPFYTTKPVGQGTGLGLAMVYGFVRQAGGHVTVYSEIGLGTTIALYFPVLGEGTAQSPDVLRQLPAQTPGNNQKVLVVEDNPQVRKLTTVRLQSLGYRVQEAASGDHAAEVLRQDSDIDAVFTDLVMPGELDGLALARHVVASYPNLRILLTSGYAEDILARYNESEPGHQILRKPYRQSDLAAALSALFDGG